MGVTADPLFDLTGKTAVVTGASGVLCSEIAIALADRGAKVALLGRTLKNVEAVSTTIKAKGGSSKAYSCDVMVVEALENVRKEINRDLGTCDILINGAGGNHPDATTQNPVYDHQNQNTRTFFDMPVSAFQQTFDLNLVGTLLPIKIFARDMVDKHESVVLNVSSMSAFNPLTKVPAYSGAKAAVNNLTQWLATYFAPVNMRVNAIAPGFFLTSQNKQLLTNEDGSLTPRAQQIIANTPMKRFGDPGDLCGTVIWLCSDASRFVTGVVIPVDGGFSAFGGV
ncbi:MAG: putative oxidoreductase UxuB [Cyclobacteriaceae bacterium]|nr:MAG: putative oxidoreductase UxuB [Cyclobacteriaceae bacterium]